MRKLYSYIGPEAIRTRAISTPGGTAILSARDLVEWVNANGQTGSADGLIPLTFVVDETGILRVADRSSEHVACAGGGPVLAAGELFLALSPTGPEVREASNQSTGFCPEPESWPALAAALDRAGIPHPGRFTLAVVFRRCPRCGERNVVKDGWFICGVCGADLPAEWNF